MTKEAKDGILTGFLKWLGFGGIVALLSLTAWATKMHFQLATATVLAAQHEVDLAKVKTEIELHKEFIGAAKNQLMVFDMRLAKMERNLIRLCVAAKAKCED